MRMTRARASTLNYHWSGGLRSFTPAFAQTSTPLRLGITPVEGAAEAFYAKDVGFFAKAGLSVDVQSFLAVPAIAAALASSLDVGYATVDTLAVLHHQKIPLVVIAPAAEYLSSVAPGIVALVVPINSTVRLAKDLNGKVLATNALRSLAETASRQWIDQNGGDSTTVKFLEVPFGAMPAALEAGRVDAAYLPEPFLGTSTKSYRLLTYLLDGIGRQFLISAWFTTPQWATGNSLAVQRFAGAIRDAARWANANLSDSGAILARDLKLDPAVVGAMTRGRFAEQLGTASMQPLIDVSAKYNGFETFPARELIYVAAH